MGANGTSGADSPVIPSKTMWRSVPSAAGTTMLSCIGAGATPATGSMRIAYSPASGAVNSAISPIAVPLASLNVR